MRQSFDPVPQSWPRRLVLGGAVVLACAVVLPRTSSPVDAAPVLVVAQAPAPASTDRAPAGEAKADAGKADAARSAPAKADAKAAAPKPDAQGDASTDAADKDTEPSAAERDRPTSEVTIDHRGITVHKGGRRVNVQAFGTDREYDSFEDFVNDAPWLAGLVFLVVLMVFLTPLLIVVLLIWYKVRKTRMQNETMLRLAEKGVAPADAIATMTGGTVPANVLPPGSTPLYEQARALRKHAAWSDLRKGVILLAVGLGLCFFSIFDDGTPNSVGLVLLFLGIGYCILWYFEDRRTPAEPQRGTGVPPPGSA